MSEAFQLDAESRSDMGKGASRRLRRENKVPGIIYGGSDEPQSITLDHFQVLQRLDNEAFYSHILTLSVDGKSQEVVLRDLQRHPAKPVILHMDFQRVSSDREIHVHVPLHFLNEEKCYGVKMTGGLLSKIVTEVEVSCFPQSLPEYIEVDLIDLKLGESLHLSDIQLPEGVALVALSHGDGHDTGIAAVHKTRGSSEEEESADAGDADAAEGGDA